MVSIIGMDYGIDNQLLIRKCFGSWAARKRQVKERVDLRVHLRKNLGYHLPTKFNSSKFDNFRFPQNCNLAKLEFTGFRSCRV